MAYFGETVAQAGLIGVALGLALQMDVTWGVLIVALAVAALLLWFGRQKLVALDSVLGLLHHAALAAGVIATSMIKGAPVDLTGFLFGDVFAVTGTDVAIIFIGGAGVLAVVAWLWQPLLRLAVHEELAAAEGVDRETVRTVFIVLLAVTIAVAMKIVGILLVMAFLVVPAVAARPLARTPERMVAVNRPDRRRQRPRRPVAVGHSRQPRRPVDRHRHVGRWPGYRSAGPPLAARVRGRGSRRPAPPSGQDAGAGLGRRLVPMAETGAMHGFGHGSHRLTAPVAAASASPAWRSAAARLSSCSR